MASLGSALVSNVLGHSDAEKAFRPWWDNFEDFLVYGLVMLGLLVAPTTIINSTPLDCNFCQFDYCEGKFQRPLNASKVNNPNFNAWWIKKYCTMTAMDGFMLYFPYILLFIALSIVLTERAFIRFFKAGLRLESFYSLIVKDIMEGEADNPSSKIDSTGSELNQVKAALKVAHSFSKRSSYYLSYLLRTAVELGLALVLLTWLIWFGIPSILGDKFIYCDIHGYHYECSGHPQELYKYVLFVATGLLCIYLFCNIYNLLWLCLPSMRTLHNVMQHYKTDIMVNSKLPGNETKLLGELYNAYYKGHDLKLLLDLLAQSSGIAPALKIMSLFDKGFNMGLQPFNLTVERSHGRDECSVSFEDAPTMKDVFRFVKDITCIYTVEIVPPVLEVSVVALDSDEKNFENRGFHQSNETNLEDLKLHNKRTTFENMDPNVEYRIVISTIINGKTLANKMKII